MSKINDVDAEKVSLEVDDENQQHRPQIEATGDAPDAQIEPAYANIRPFWVSFCTAGATGALLGLLALGYVKAVDDVPRKWSQYNNSEYPNTADSLDFAAGKPWWVAMGLCTGLLVGILRAATKLYEWPTFADELREREVDIWTGCRVSVFCCISLMGGACLGPEAGLGAAGSVFGQAVASVLKKVGWDAGVDPKELTIAGAAGALAALLPSPFLSVVLCSELCGWPTARTAAMMLASTTASYAVYWAIDTKTYLDLPALEARSLSAHSAKGYDWAIGCLFGVIGSVCALCHCIIGGITKTVFVKLSNKLDSMMGINARTVALSAFTGLVYGILVYIFPMTLGSGTQIMSPVIALGGQLSTRLLIPSMIAKSVSFWACKEGGLVGGIIFPLLLIGVMASSVAVNITGVDSGLAINCSFAAVAAAFVPLPVFWILLTFLSFLWDQEVLFPIYTSVGTAYLMFVGIGTPQALMKLAAKRRAKQKKNEENMSRRGSDANTGSV